MFSCKFRSTMPAKPLDYGVPNKHILKSYGGDSDVMKFYCTTNNTTYGRKWAKFEPRNGRHTGTGYVSNHRPGVYYSARIDEVDNPAMGLAYIHVNLSAVISLKCLTSSFYD